MSEALVERLRDADANSQQRVLGSRIFGEAADRIEALERELEEAERANRAMAKNGLDLANSWQQRAEAAEAREARLSEALRRIEGLDSHIDATPRGDRKVIGGEFAQIARAALSGSGSGWREPEPIKEVKALRQALLDCRERAETGGRRIETAMDACEDISEIATCALPPEGWQGPAALAAKDGRS